MAYNVIWSEEAESSFFLVIDDLLFRWSAREVSNFISRTEEVISQIVVHPFIFKEYEKDKSIRHGILHKNTTMFYRVDKNNSTIQIMLFWNSKRDPEGLKL